MQLLDFHIPPFKTIAWVSDEASDYWEPRFTKVNEAILASILMGLEENRWKNRRIRIPGWLYFRLLANLKKYAINRLDIFLGDENISGPVFYEVLLQKESIQENDIPFLAIPSCCHTSNQLARMKNRKEFIWEIATASEERQIIKNTTTLNQPVVAGALWQQLLINPVAYHTCSFYCTASLRMQNEQLKSMNDYGFNEEAALLTEIYKWPVEWSCAHGIGEIRTPVVKLAFDTDATGEKYAVKIQGNAYPSEGVPGLTFPYRQQRFLKISDSKSFKEGLKHGA